MTHYICTGSCGGGSDTSKVCDAKFCSKEGRSLVPCDCEDGLHETAGENKEGENDLE